MASYIVRGQMWRRHDGQRFYPGQTVEIDGKAPEGWEPVKPGAPDEPKATDAHKGKSRRPSDGDPI